MRKIVSRLVGDGNWWGSQSKLDVAEPFDEHHWPAALRTGPKRPRRRVGSFFRPGFGRNPAPFGKPLQAERERSAATAMRQKPEVADADESRRQHVQQESAQELANRQSHQTLFVLVSGIAPAESDVAIGECDESMV